MIKKTTQKTRKVKKPGEFGMAQLSHWISLKARVLVKKAVIYRGDADRRAEGKFIEEAIEEKYKRDKK